MPHIDRRSMMMMTGIAALSAAVPLPKAEAEPVASAAPVNYLFADDFDGPAGAPPDYSKWAVIAYNEPVNPPILGLFRDDRRNVFLDGNGNLVLRATQEGNTYFSGRVESTMKIGIGHTWEARMKLNCLVPGCWPAFWLVNREPTPDGRGPLPDGEVDIVEWYGNGKWAPGTSVHARSDGKTWKEHRWPVDGAWHTYRCRWDDQGFQFWLDNVDGPPFFTVPAEPIDGVWPFNQPGYLLYTLFNLAVGGPGGGDPAFNMFQPPEMLIDYVRVW